MPDPYTAIQVIMMPRDTNPHGTIFGGVILSYIDLAGAIAARREVQLRGGPADGLFVTVAINSVVFKRPVLVGGCGQVSDDSGPSGPHVDHIRGRRDGRTRGRSHPGDGRRGGVCGCGGHCGHGASASAGGRGIGSVPPPPTPAPGHPSWPRSRGTV